ncbi:hypothetical protein CsSME_00040103 [Camellia sinensis var. sinensis]
MSTSHVYCNKLCATTRTENGLSLSRGDTLSIFTMQFSLVPS